ncbi:radical SAM protein [Ruminiclostridium herbifermentans]|uniref:Radical SAM protein n=1 Tax=Ruminiclostridium herbifermentans TaxID=2488810 RepID=A0A4U7JIF1_9FIRM|nr:radical SAM protein [Ruminiclostridium herbifermentans]QNU65381.1 radical SAM protein [Ruminiclostridium herbifermentans]
MAIRECYIIKRHIVVPVFVPHKGCPFDCIFCNQKIISGQINDANEDEIRKSIEDTLSTSGDAFVEVAFYGGSFTGIPIEEQEWYLKIGYSYIKAGKVTQLRLSTRPDYINEEILDLLSKYGVKTIELGVQSLDEQVLALSHRGHNIEAVTKAAKMIKARGFSLGIQTMVGLPEDSKEKAINTANSVVKLVPDIVRIYPTLVIKNTYLQKMYLEEKYKPLTVEEAVEICAELLAIYQQNNINVIRIGLQPTENINDNGDVVAGPFHPAFRQLVESRLLLNKIEKYIEENNFAKLPGIVIECNERQLSNIIGQKRANISYLKNKFNFNNVIVKVNNDIEHFQILKL